MIALFLFAVPDAVIIAGEGNFWYLQSCKATGMDFCIVTKMVLNSCAVS